MLLSIILLFEKSYSLKPQIVAIYPKSTKSFFNDKPFNIPIDYDEALDHLSYKLTWDDKNINMHSIITKSVNQLIYMLL